MDMQGKLHGGTLTGRFWHCRNNVKPAKIVTDKQSGKSLDRPGYAALKAYFELRPGDVLLYRKLGPTQQK